MKLPKVGVAKSKGKGPTPEQPRCLAYRCGKLLCSRLDFECARQWPPLNWDQDLPIFVCFARPEFRCLADAPLGKGDYSSNQNDMG